MNAILCTLFNAGIVFTLRAIRRLPGMMMVMVGRPVRLYNPLVTEFYGQNRKWDDDDDGSPVNKWKIV